MTEEKKKQVDIEIDKMLAENIIEHTLSPYLSEAVMVLKPNNEWRFCVDYRPLNEIIILDNYMMLLVSDLLAVIKDSKYFVQMDLRSSYWQIPMEKDSVKFTAFRCHQGVFEFKVMPYGLVNAPATFQRLMDYMFNDLKNQGLLVYMDDINMHAKIFEKLVELTYEVFC